ncbi:MAG: hypothetical protein GTO02_13570 [Candidatus Dadabacteria bacterium]|nr:hypothetical protein [Candidatus Dadabacteria bacterium]
MNKLYIIKVQDQMHVISKGEHKTLCKKWAVHKLPENAQAATEQDMIWYSDCDSCFTRMKNIFDQNGIS